MTEKAYAQRTTRRKPQRGNQPEGQEDGMLPLMTLTTPQVVQMQRTIGNRAVQRLMDVATAGQRIAPKSVSKAGAMFGTKKSRGGSDINMNREALLRMLESVHDQLNSRVAPNPQGMMGQLQDISNAYDGVVASVTLLLEKLKDNPTDDRYRAALELRVQATNEKTQLLKIFMDRMKNPPPGRVMPTVKSLMSDIPVYMDSNLVTGQVGGGMNTLTKFSRQDGDTDYFKPNVNSIDHYGSLREADDVEQNELGPVNNKLMEESGQLMDSPEKIRNMGQGVDDNVDYGQFGGREGYAQAFGSHQKKGVNTEFKEHAGIDLENLRSSNREVAMARIDMLLDANLISKANLAIKRTGISQLPQLGSVAKGAKGKEVDKYNRVDDQNAHPRTNDTIAKDDPSLMSKLNALQMIDFIAGQVDRHQGNYMIEVDGGGNVIGVTGIDNDMSFGTKDTGSMGQRGARQLPGLGMYFDKDMANKILALDPFIVRLALSDLLTAPEVNATVERIQLLQQQIQIDINNLLDPGQWAQLIVTDRRAAKKQFKQGDYNTSVINAI